MKALTPTGQAWGNIVLQDSLFQKYGSCDSGPSVQYGPSSNSRCERRELSLVYFAREPFTRLLGSYRDKIERLKGRQFYYESVTQNILRTKYPKAYLPLWGTGWNHGKCNNLTVTFENVLEYIISEQITGYDPDYIPDYKNCNVKKLVSPILSKIDANGFRKTVNDMHFVPQTLLCRVCGHKDSLQNVICRET